MKKIISFLLFFVTIQFYAQNNGVVKGFVYDKETGEPVTFVNVFFKGTTIGANTDLNGYFYISRIPIGDYTLLITSFEHDTIKDKITIKSGDILQKKYFAKKGGKMLEEIEVTTAAADKVEKTSVSVQKIDPIVINKLPSVGEPDIAQYLQVIPGVAFTGDQGGQLYIRGGLPVQNKVLLDGLVIYNPFHSIGLFSVFDNDIMKNADVYTAGFGAEYGGRTSSVMDITTRDGNKKRISGKVSGSTFGGKMMLEGPLKKLKEDAGGSSSFLVSAKHSYLPQSSKVLYSYADTAGLPFYYTDLYAKTSFNSGTGSKINFFGFNFSDRVDFSQIAQFGWTNRGIGSNFLLLPGNADFLMEGNFCYSQYEINFKNPLVETDTKKSTINGVNTGFNFTKFIGRNEIKFGFEGVTTNTNYELQNPFGAEVKLARQTIDLGAFVKTKIIDKNKKVVFEPSFRTQYYATIGAFSPEPRVALKVNILEKLRFKGAAGLYSQSLLSANSDRDVVNLFYGFINAPENNDVSKTYLDKNGETKTVNSSIQKANHMVAGFEIDIAKGLDLNIEAYQKNFNTIINVNRDKIFNDNDLNSNQPDEYKKTFVIEQGRARGFDVLLKYERKQIYVWAVYSLAFNDRWQGNNATNQILNYAPNFDRRHNINLVTSYTFGKKKNCEFNARWNLGTGFPFTQTQGFIPTFNPAGNINYNFNQNNPNLGYIPATLNGGRLPDYHRLDLSLKYKYQHSEKVMLEISGGATNIYNRQNIFYVDRFTFKRINQLPILPNLNLTLSF